MRFIRGNQRVSDDSLFLSPDDSWQQKYSPGGSKWKRLDLFKTMAGAQPG